MVDPHFIMALKPGNRSRSLVTKGKVEVRASTVSDRGRGGVLA